MSDRKSAVGFSAAEMPWPVRHVEAILTALGHGLDVEFRFTREDIDPWFRLRGYRGVIHVLGPSFDHFGTVALVEAALARGWELGGPMGQAQGASLKVAIE